MMLSLNCFEQIGSGSEVLLLPPVSIPTRVRFVRFPVSTKDLRPSLPQMLVEEIPRFSIFEFDKVLLHGFRLFEKDNRFFNDYSLVDEKGRSGKAFFEKLSRGQAEDVVVDERGAVCSRGGGIIRMDGSDTLLLQSDEPSNFGSWIFRILPKLILSRQNRKIKKIFVYNNQKWMKSIVDLVDGEIEVIAHRPHMSYEIETAAIPSLPAPSAFFRQEIRDGLCEIVDRLESKRSTPELIYVSRRLQSIEKQGFRVLENETELVEKLRNFGFYEFIPERYPIEEQMSVFSRARVIITVGGSNLFCAAFMRSAEFILDIESGSDWIHAHCNLIDSTGVPFSAIMGTRNDRGSTGHLNWTIDVDAVVEGLVDKT